MLIAKILSVTVKLKFNVCHSRRFYSDLKILYFGTDKFSLPSLMKLSQQRPLRLEVVTSFKARNNPIKSFAERKAIKIHDWTVLSKNENYKICSEFDLGLVVSFGHLIPENIINSFRSGMLNVHASLLPKYRGASPIVYAIRNGESETGVSIMRIKPNKFDVGEVLATERVEISDDVMMPELHDKLSSIGAELLVKCVRDLDKHRPIEQDNSLASYAPKIDSEFCKVRWCEMSSTEVFNLHRSIYSFKNILTSFNGEPVKLMEILKAEIHPQNDDFKHCRPGHVLFCRKSKKLLAKCLDGNFIEIKQLSIGKKKAMSAADFNNGFLKKCNEADRNFE